VHETLTRNLYFVKKRLGLFKAAFDYDILAPESGETILECREPDLRLSSKTLRFIGDRRMMPFNVSVCIPGGEPVIQLKRGWTFMRSSVRVTDGAGAEVGGFRQRVLTIGGSFDIFDPQEEALCSLRGTASGWEYRCTAPNETELAHVTKMWAGIGKEFFTSAQNFILKIADDVPADDPARTLILAAVLCIGIVLKE
jgi:hypothetical protein